MRFSGLRLFAFGFVGIGSMLFLAWFDAPGRAVDRHTGRVLDRFGHPIARRPVRTPEEALAEARVRGEVRLSLGVIRAARAEIGAAERLVTFQRALECELLAPQECVAALAVERPDLAARLRADIELARTSLAELVGTGPDAGAVLALLRSSEDQVEACDQVERFFAPVDGGREATTAELEAMATAWESPDLIAAIAMANAGDAEHVEPAAARAVARAMAGAGRRRGRIRWLLRAWERKPAAAANVTALVAACLEYGLTDAAHVVLEAAHGAGLDTAESWQQQARLASWLGRPECEAIALERVVRLAPDLDARRRAVEIYRFTGDLDRALAQASAIATATGDPTDLDHAASMALANGQAGEAVRFLRLAAAADPDDPKWHDRVADALVQDMRSDEAIAYLRELARNRPGSPEERRLEELLRRRSRNAELADLLEARVARTGDADARRELTGLLIVLGRTERVRELEQESMERATDPATFFRLISLYRQLRLDGLPERAREMALSPRLDTAAYPQVIGAMEALASQPPFAAAVTAFADRFADRAEARALLTVVIDSAGDPVAVAETAERAWRSRPGRDDLLDGWVERAGWAGLLEPEIRGRETLAERRPRDAENLRRLGDLLEAGRRMEDALATWESLHAIEGPGGPAEERVLMALLALDREEAALELLAGRMDRGGLPIAERLALAERFFAAQWVDRALQLFEGVLAEDPDQPLALLRVGQSRAWGNDPSGSIPYFERLIGLTGDGDGEVPFLLGEAYWATRRDSDGRALHARALPLLRESGTLTAQRESMVAKVFARLGRADESQAVYQRLVAADPRNQNLAMDYADAMLAVQRRPVAREALEIARPLGPDDRRFLRIDGQVRIEESLYEQAVVALRRGLELYGPDAGFHSDLGRALEPLGRWREAYDAYDTALELQPGNEDVTFMRRIVADRLAHPTLEAAIRSFAVGDDSTWGLLLEGTVLLEGDRLRLSAALDHAEYTGRANAFRRSRRDVAADVGTFSLALSYRLAGDDDPGGPVPTCGMASRLGFGNFTTPPVDTSDDSGDTSAAAWEIGGGLDAYSGRGDGGDDAGFWLGVGRRVRDPYRAFGVRLHVNEVLAEPAAAPGLGGSSDGLHVEAFQESREQWWWVSAAGDVERLSIEHPRRGRLEDVRARGEFVLGRWLRRTGPDITERLRVRRVPTATQGTSVRGEPSLCEGPRMAAWIAYHPVRLLDGQDLAGPIPLGADFDYLSAALRVVDHAGAGVLWEAEGNIGTDLRGGDAFGGVRLGLAWRPEEETEVRLALSHGRAVGRAESDGATTLTLAVTLRW